MHYNADEVFKKTFVINTVNLFRWAIVKTCIKDIHIFVDDMPFGVSYKPYQWFNTFNFIAFFKAKLNSNTVSM